MEMKSTEVFLEFREFEPQAERKKVYFVGVVGRN